MPLLRAASVAASHNGLPAAARGDLVRAKLADSDPFVRRAAAEALAEHPEPASIQPLVRAWLVAPSDDVQVIQALPDLLAYLMQPSARP